MDRDAGRMIGWRRGKNDWMKEGMMEPASEEGRGAEEIEEKYVHRWS